MRRGGRCDDHTEALNMRYLLTIYDDESSWNDVTPEQSAQIMAAYGAFGEAAQRPACMLGGEGLQPTSTATTVRVRDGEALDDRRPVRGDPRAARRLLPARLQGPRRGHRAGRRRSRAPRTARSRCARSWTTRRWAAKRPTRRPRAWRSTLSAPGVDHRPPVPARVGTGGRRPGACVRRPRPGRGGGPGCLCRRARALAARRRAAEPGRVDRADRPAARRSTGCAARSARARSPTPPSRDSRRSVARTR